MAQFKKPVRFAASILAASSLLIMSCSEDDKTDESSSTSAIISGITTANSKLTATSDMIVPSASAASFKGIVAQSTKIDSVWTTSAGVNSLSNSGTSTLKDWIGNMFDPSFVNSNSAKVTFAGRISNAMMVLCVLGAAGLPTDSTGLPSDGTHTATLTAAMFTTCGDSSSSAMDGASISITVSTPSDTTIYDKEFSIGLPGAESCPFKFLARANSSAVNIATAEDQSCDGRDQASRSVVRYDASSGAFRFTYISQAFSGSSSGFEFYRGYYKQSTDEAYVLGFYGGDTNPSANSSANLNNYIGFSAAGRPTAGGTVAVSAKVKGMTISDDVYNGCINSSDGSVASTTDTLACSLGSGVDMTTYFSTITSAYDANSSRNQIYSITGTTDVGFTDNSDMF